MACWRAAASKLTQWRHRYSGAPLLAVVFKGIAVRQVRELGAHFSAHRQRRLRKDIGGLPIGSVALGVQSSDRDALDFAAAAALPGKLQTFRLEPISALGRHRFRLSFWLHRILAINACRPGEDSTFT